MPDLRRRLHAPRLFRARILIAAALLAGLPSGAPRLQETASPGPSGPLQVRILSPLASETVLGSTEIVIEAAAPAGSRLLKIEIYADDRLIGTMLEPPWRYTWDAGDALRARTLRVRAYSSDGSTASDKVVTRAITGVQRAAVTLVEVPCTVRTSQGAYLSDLRREEFTLLEWGRPQEITLFSSERKPVHLALLFDASASMTQEGRLQIAQEAATGFIDAMEPGDTAVLLAFSDAPRVVVAETSDKAALRSGLASIEARGGTALYDALVASVDLLAPVEGRKAIILLSDGRDESSDGLGPGSFRTYEEALDTVLAGQTAVYAIATGERLAEDEDVLHRHTVGEILGNLSERSGGRAWFVKKASKLKEAYRSVADELRHQYTLGYSPPADAPKGARAVEGHGPGWRPIEVRVSRPRARVTARSGYYADRQTAGRR
jgi:Ca-activated chloride channel homolog